MARGSDDEMDMDLDEELLMITEKKSNKRNKSTESSDEDYEEKSSKKKKTAPGRKKGSSISSLQSTSTTSYGRSGRNRGAPIEQHDDDFFDDYDEDLYKDEDDRIELSKLPEVEREQILAVRYEKRKEAKEKWQRDKEKEKEKKSSASSASASSTTAATSSDKYKTSSSTRTRADKESDNKKEALKEIQRKREKSKKDKDDLYDSTSSTTTSTTTVSTTSPIGSSSQKSKQDQDREKEREREKEIYREREKEREIEKEIQKSVDTLTIQQMNHCRLSRNMLVKWVDQPYFERLAPGFFVRVVIGSHLNSPIYRIAEIVEVRTGHKLYKVENKETDKLLWLSYAGSKKEFGIENVSNNVITQAEHEKWISDMIRSGEPLPTPESLENKIQDIKKAQEYIYTNEDIEKRAQERMKYQKTPHNISFEKAKLIALRETLDVDSPDYQKIVDRIEELNKMAIEQKEETMTNSEKLVSEINKKNKSLNFQYSQSASTSTTETISNEFDPFARRKTRSSAVNAAEVDPNINPNASPLAAALSPKSENKSLTPSPSTPTPTQSNQSKEEQSTKSLVNIHKSIELNITIPDTHNKVLQVNPIKKKRQIIPANIIKSDNSKYKNILSFDEYLNKRQIK